MTSFLSFEWLKLERRWMPRVVLLLLLGLTILGIWGEATRSEGQGNIFLPRTWLATLTFCSFFAPFFWPVLGGSWAGNEYSWGTIRSVLTRRPFRIEHVFAALVVLVVGIGLSLIAILVVGSIAGMFAAAVTGHAVFTPGVLTGTFLVLLVKGFLIAWYVSAFYLVLAYGAATVFRSAAVGIGFGIGLTLAQFILVGIFRDLGGWWNDAAQHFPVIYTRDVNTRVVHSGLIPGTNLASVTPDAPSAGVSIVGIAIYGAIVLAVTLVAVRSRDVTA